MQKDRCDGSIVILQDKNAFHTSEVNVMKRLGINWDWKVLGGNIATNPLPAQVRMWAGAYADALLLFAECGWFAGKDQALMAAACLKEDGLCEFVQPQPGRVDLWHALVHLLLET
jgi:hypothetical protein